MLGRERQRPGPSPRERRHFRPRALQDARDLRLVASFSEPNQLRFQENQTCAILERLRFGVPLESALLHQRAHALDCYMAYPARREKTADGLRLSPRGIAPPPKVSLAAQGKLLARIAPPLEMLRADGYLEVFRGHLGEQA